MYDTQFKIFNEILKFSSSSPYYVKSSTGQHNVLKGKLKQ